MRRLDRGEGRQLERQWRMTGAHDVVIGEALVVANMAAHTALGALDRTIGRIHPRGDIGRVINPRHMRAEPVLRAPVAGFAADTIGNLERWAAAILRHVVGVAIEADFGVLRVRQAEVAGDPQSPLLAQHREGLAVLILLSPDQVLVLIDMRVSERLNGAMAVVAGTRGDADMHRIHPRRVRLRHGLLRRSGSGSG